MAFFSANPLATPIGQKIEQATSDNLPTEDWGLNLEICDLINSSEECAKDAVKAIKKRLSQTPKNYKVVMYTLTVLETCVKNTGHKFHVLVCSKEFIQDLVKLIGPKNDPPAAIQSKVLSLIQAWAETFKQLPELSGVTQVYADLRHKGVEFPPPEADATPIITPTPSVAPRDNVCVAAAVGPRPPPVGGASPRHPPAIHHATSPSATAALPPQLGISSDVRSKLEKELAVVESNATVLSEMLSELTPGQEHTDDLHLLQELHATCQTMQKRLVELVARVSDDVLTADILRINDLLNNLFIRYDRFMSKSHAKGSPVKSPDETIGSSHRPYYPPGRPATDAPAAAGAAQPVEEVSLIDLNDDDATAAPPVTVRPQLDSLTQQMAGIDLMAPHNKAEDADFDSFAQSRTLPTDAPSKKEPEAGAAAAAAVGIEPEQVESNFESMERWMSSQPYGSEISSDAFQRFLADRAAAADQLPTISAVTGSTSPSAAGDTAAPGSKGDTSSPAPPSSGAGFL